MLHSYSNRSPVERLLVYIRDRGVHPTPDSTYGIQIEPSRLLAVRV